ncbi:hypothetical protein [Thalassospira australica]|uniref:hypothetical protein n=1 Tax=Thalassospira australica TaxID=1528106 RepID=UPI00384ADF41
MQITQNDAGQNPDQNSPGKAKSTFNKVKSTGYARISIKNTVPLCSAEAPREMAVLVGFTNISSRLENE